jgi:hypothetical protein
LGSSLAEASRPETQGQGPWSDAGYRNGSDIESDNYVAPASTYAGGQAWAADVAARRAGASGRQLDELLAGVGADISVDTRPGSVYVQAGDSLSKIAARFPEYGNANDLKNQLIAANPQLRDPNALTEGMELNFPGAGTVVDRAAMARAVGADGRYQAALAARAQPSGNGLSFDGLSFADLALGGGSPSLGGSTSLSGMQRAQAHALGVYDAGAGAVEGAGYSFGVVGTPESRAAWAVQTSKAAVEGIQSFINDPKGAVSGWWDNLTGDDPAAIRQATAQGTGIAIGVAGGVAMGRLGAAGTPAGLRTSALISGERAEAFLVKNGFSADRAKDFVASFNGPITARLVRPGEDFFRYTDAPESTGSFLTKTQFANPPAAVDGLYLGPYGNNATFVQSVGSTGRSIVLEGNIANGGVGIRQSVVVNRDTFQFGTGVRY